MVSSLETQGACVLPRDGRKIEDRTEPGGLCVGDAAKIFHIESQYFDSRCLSCLQGPLATPGLTPIRAPYRLTF